MLKKLNRTNTPGVFKWKIWLRLPNRIVHTHVELNEVQAQHMYAELLEQRARQSLGLVSSTVLGAHALGNSAAAYEADLRQQNRDEEHITQVVNSLALLREQLGDDFLVSSITREHIRVWRERRQSLIVQNGRAKGRCASGRTVNKCLSHLSAFFTWVCEEGWAESNPAQYVANIKTIKPPLRYLPWSAFEVMMQRVWDRRPRLGLFLEVLAETGARIDEVFRARVGDVDIKRRVWTKVVKPGKVLVIDTYPLGWVMLAAHGRKVEEPLIPREDGEPWTYSMIRKALPWLTQGLGVKGFSPHWLRHSRACWDLADGVPLDVVKTRLGHSSIQVTEWYIREVELVRREDANVKLHRHTPG